MQVLQKAVVGTQLIEYENTIRSKKEKEKVTSQAENIIGNQENENTIAEFENTNTSQGNRNKIEMITSQFENFIQHQNKVSSESCFNKSEIALDGTKNLNSGDNDLKFMSNSTVESNNATNHHLLGLSEDINKDSGDSSTVPENRKQNHQLKNLY